MWRFGARCSIIYHISSSLVGHVCWRQFFVIIDNPVMNIPVRKSECTHTFLLGGRLLRADPPRLPVVAVVAPPPTPGPLAAADDPGPRAGPGAPWKSFCPHHPLPALPGTGSSPESRQGNHACCSQNKRHGTERGIHLVTTSAGQAPHTYVSRPVVSLWKERPEATPADAEKCPCVEAQRVMVCDTPGVGGNLAVCRCGRTQPEEQLATCIIQTRNMNAEESTPRRPQMRRTHRHTVWGGMCNGPRLCT